MTITHRCPPRRGRPAQPAPLVLGALALLLAACGGDSREGTDSAAAAPRPGVAAAVRAPGDTTCPLTGVWRECNVLDRLEKAGMAPRRMDGTIERPGFGAPGIRYTLGKATLEVFLYESEADRIRHAGALDSATASPPGKPTEWPQPPVLMESGNLAAVFHGGRAREAERVALALTAGLPQR